MEINNRLNKYGNSEIKKNMDSTIMIMYGSRCPLSKYKATRH